MNLLKSIIGWLYFILLALIGCVDPDSLADANAGEYRKKKPNWVIFVCTNEDVSYYNDSKLSDYDMKERK